MRKRLLILVQLLALICIPHFAAYAMTDLPARSDSSGWYDSIFEPREAVYWTENISSQGLLDLYDAAHERTTSRCILDASTEPEWDALLTDIIARRQANCVMKSEAVYPDGSLYIYLLVHPQNADQAWLLASYNPKYLEDACERLVRNAGRENDDSGDYWFAGIDPAE